MRILLALLFVVLSLPAAAQDTAAPAREKVFNAEYFTLDNGMQVVLVPNHRAPVITHMVWYGVGAADEKRGQSGLAHFVEHLMFKGTEKIPPGEFSTRIKAMGGNDNAFTAQDITAYFQSISSDRLETVMEMEADRMTNLIFPPEDVESEKLVVLEERRQRTENDPRGYFFEQMNAIVFPNHPYANPVIGWLHETEALTRENVMAFYKEWYAPNNAILVVSGDVTMDTLRPLAERIYGSIPAREVPDHNWTAVPPLKATQKLIFADPSIQQPMLSRVFRVPSENQNKEESLALEVLASVMGDGQSARMYKSLVAEQKLASGISFHYSGSARSDGTLRITANPAEGTDMDTLETAIDSQLRKLVSEGVTETELSEAKTRLIDAAVFARDSLQGPAMVFGYGLTVGSSIDDIEYWPHNISQVTAEQIQAVAAKYLDPDNVGDRPYTTGYLLPKAQPAPAPEHIEESAE